MKTISARQFRVTFGELQEPVMVLRREPGGAFALLGTWTPGDGRIAASMVPVIDPTADHFGRPTAAPKGGKR